MFEKILVANRGEIAVRIIRTCKQMKIKTVAVYSEADSRSLHVQEADEAFLLGPSPANQSYLLQDKIIEVAMAQNCQAIHPGYGFLSENDRFARMVTESGLVFIGPPASAIALLGDKIASKELARKAGLPVVPGLARPLSDPAELPRLAEEVGFPLLLKPAAGGGGKGMRIVADKEDLASAFSQCQEETRKAFGDERIFLEKYITQSRHVEIQILADGSGNVIYLGERECSIQRRYQKIVEETPSLALDEQKRKQMGTLACALAREAGYVNAGTVEFILDMEGNFYFLEMNTRLQVEHPVTEMVFSLDLVELQLRIAAGQPLSLKQEDVSSKGWAMEARICAEDPFRGFLPATGLITRYAVPKNGNIRVDNGIEAGSLVTVYYDSLLSKVVAWGENREQARKTLVHALNGYHIEGVTTNVDFVNALLSHPAFREGKLSTDFVSNHFEEGEAKDPPPVETLHYMVIAATLVYHNRNNLVRDSLKPMATRVGVSLPAKDWFHYTVKGRKDYFKVRLSRKNNHREWTIRINGNRYQVTTPEFEYYRRRLNLSIDDQSSMFRLQYQGNFIWAAFRGVTRTFEIYSPMEWDLARYMPGPKESKTENSLACPMPGLVVSIRVKEGEQVYRGQDLISIESMKMESFVASPTDGVVEKVLIEPGQTVERGDILVTFAE